MKKIIESQSKLLILKAPQILYLAIRIESSTPIHDFLQIHSFPVGSPQTLGKSPLLCSSQMVHVGQSVL